MTIRTHRGSCHCGAVRIEADLDLAAGSARCNCSICSKSRAWGIAVKPEAFRLLAGEEALTEYRFGTRSIQHLFCRTCGIGPFGRGHLDVMGGDFVVVNVACLDDVTPDELAAVPVSYADGRNNAWMSPPTVTSYL